jgi:hypothetical protein
MSSCGPDDSLVIKLCDEACWSSVDVEEVFFSSSSSGYFLPSAAEGFLSGYKLSPA